MSEPNPVIMTGPRSQRVGDPETKSTVMLSLSKRPDVPPTRPGMVVLRSRYAKFRVQLSSPSPQLDPKTGRYMQPESLFIQFNNHVALLFPEKNEKDREKLELALEHKNFGLNRAFWRAEEEIKAAEDKQVQQVTEFLRARSELAAKVLENLGGKTFELPTRSLESGTEETPASPKVDI